MALELKEDNIISAAHNRIYAHIVDIVPHESVKHYYYAKLLTNNFPNELLLLINEWNECVNDLCFSLLDRIEEKIQPYQLQLEMNDTKLFNLTINGSTISFFTKFPAAKGYLDDYPK